MSDIQDWINDNFNSRFGWDLNGEWLDVWATTCYYIWFWHNKETHDANYARPPQTWKVISQSINYKHATVMNIMECKRDYTWTHVRWKNPSPGWIALNTDGASKSGGIYCCGLWRTM